MDAAPPPSTAPLPPLPPLPPPTGMEPVSGRRTLLIVGFLVAVMLVVGLALIVAFVHVSPRSSASNRVRLGAVPGTDPGVGDTAAGGQGEPVDGISCGSIEQGASHFHAHLYILDEGVAQPVSAYIGIPGAPDSTRCFYWIHTHDRSGIIHIESPTGRTYTLGEVFDIWGQPLSRDRVARLPVPGRRMTVFVDGQEYPGGLRDIPLHVHTEVVIEIGKRVAPPVFDYSGY
jgi:hypothetical protein